MTVLFIYIKCHLYSNKLNRGYFKSFKNKNQHKLYQHTIISHHLYCKIKRFYTVSKWFDVHHKSLILYLVWITSPYLQQYNKEMKAPFLWTCVWFSVYSDFIQNYNKENEVKSGFQAISIAASWKKVLILPLMTISCLAPWMQVNRLLNITLTGALPRCLRWFQTNRLATQLHDRGVWITTGIQQGFVKPLKVPLRW